MNMFALSTTARRGKLCRQLTIESLEGREVPAFMAPVSYLDAGHDVEVGDFNNDGIADLITNPPGNAVSVRLGTGTGGFGAAQTSIASVTTTEPVVLAVGDFNGDTQLDVVTGNGYGANGKKDISVLLGNGDGTLTLLDQFTLSPSQTPSSIAVGDINNDNALDLVVGGSNPGNGWGPPMMYFHVLL